MSQCKVWLENYNGQYYPGAQIQGKVIVTLDSDTKLRAVKITIICYERTEWYGTERYFDSTQNEYKTRDTMFKGENEAFSTDIIVYGGQSGTTSLPAGQHMYPFNVSLPTNVPGTFNNEYGSISYKLKAMVDRPMAFDYQDEQIMIVKAPVNLNLIGGPHLLDPTSYSEAKTVCCWCCAQGPLSMDVQLPKLSLVPGETVNVLVRMSNMSNTNVEGVQLQLKQVITVLVDEPSKEEKDQTNILVDLKEVGLGAHGEHTYSFGVTLPLDAPIPNFTQCKLFKVEYFYKVEALLPSVHKNLQVIMYPTVGNIEVGGGGQQQQAGFAVPPGGFAPQHSYGGSGITHPPAGGVQVYPSLSPSAPVFDSKAQEAAGNNGGDQPPSYDSLNMN